MDNFYRELLDAIINTKGVAYTYFGSERTYRDLYDIVKKVYYLLAGRKRENIVLYSSKSFEAYGSIYAILFSGNTWVPMSPDQPVARNIEIIKMTSPKIVLSGSAMPVQLKSYITGNNIGLADLDCVVEKESGIEVVLPDYNENDIAYIMFTSGSTGVSKGVPMTHANYINFVRNCMEILPFSQGEIFSDYHDFAFDISIFYLFCCPLVRGAFAPIRTQEDLVLPLRFMIENKVTVWSSVPSVISRIQSFKPDDAVDTHIRIMFLCGEPFSLKVLKYCQRNMAIENIYNFYGLTESGVENFYYRCSPEDLSKYEKFGFVPIGNPLSGNDVKITAEKELLISGCQITPGYLGGVGTDKFEMINGKRWFHTGDIVDRHENVYFCKGRMDSQVKLSGYRVELMDIEANIRRYNGIDEAVCFVVERGNRKVLNAVVKQKASTDINIEDLKRFCLENLPPFMIPAHFFLIGEMPVNKNGKIDRRKIKEMFEKK